MSTLGRAIEIAVTAHAGQLDKGGKPYILHPLWVMNKVRHLGEDYMIVAVLHDVIEDTDWTIEMLKAENFSDHIIYSLECLDFRNKDYESQISKILIVCDTYPIPRAVKLRDLEHNTKVTRLKGLRTKDFERLAKYHKAYTYLKY